MYQFESGGINNKKTIYNIQNSGFDENLINNIKRNSDLTSISYIIFKDLANEVDVKLYNTVILSLTLADELPIPLNKNICNILFFSTCINCDSSIDCKITNFQQARTLYEIYEGDYKKISKMLDSSGKRFSMSTLEANHKNFFFEGYSIIWKIPVAFYRVEDENNPGKMIQKCTLSGIGYCEVIINEEIFKVPRLYFIKFFKNSLVNGRLICNDSSEIKECFDQSDFNTLLDILQYCGFRYLNQLKNIIIPACYIVLDKQNNKIKAHLFNERMKKNVEFLNDESQSIFWKQIDNNNYKLLPNLNYIPLNIENSDYFKLLAK